MLKEKNQLTVDRSRFLLVTAILKQVHYDLHITKNHIKQAYKSWRKTLDKKKPDLNQVNNKRRLYEELMQAKKDAWDFIETDRLEDFLDDWGVNLDSNCVKVRLKNPEPIDALC